MRNPSDHYVTKETTESLDSSSASLFETVARLAESWVEWVGDLG